MSTHRHIPRKRFGQHFLVDSTIIEQIVAAIDPKPNDHVFEIGPGEGVLTASVIDRVARYDAIELDRDLIATLNHRFGQHAGFTLHAGDVLKFDWSLLQGASSIRVIGNLPYNISTPLLFRCFEALEKITDIHVMLQKEVGHRLSAKPGTKAYGRLSVVAQYHCHIESLFEVPPTAFNPPPKVDSVVLRLRPRSPQEKKCNNVALLEDIANHAFQQRRKTVQNALRRLIDRESLNALNIDPTLRPECLSVDDFVALANWLDSRNSNS